MAIYKNYKNYLILIVSKRLNYQKSSLIKNYSLDSSIDKNQSEAQLKISNSLKQTKANEETYQFNEQLIRRIKKNQLFSITYAKESSKDVPKVNLSSDIQKYIPSVSKIINETMTEDNIKVLEIWKAKMIKKLGLIGFQKYQNDLFSRGKRLHKNIEYKLKHNEENIKIDEDLNGFWTSLQPVLAEVKDVHLIEERLTHSNLLYKGIVDCVATFNRTNTVVDWKTSEKVKDTLTKLYDAPIQTVAYLGALNQSDLLNFELDKVAVVVAYNDGRIANYHQLGEKDFKSFWNTWVKKVEQYWINKLSNAPADPCIISHFNELLTSLEEKNKKIYQFNKLKSDDQQSISKKDKSKDAKKPKTKEELMKLLNQKK